MKNPEYYFSFFPQFCSDPINDRAWGQGFTDWDLIHRLPPEKAALFSPLTGIYDPSHPTYPNLLADQLQSLQLPSSGIMLYHYFFDGVHALQGFEKNLLESPKTPSFFLCWANESWTKRWIGRPGEIIIEQSHRPDISIIRKHAEYLTCFFKHPNYKKLNSRPLFLIYNPHSSPNLLLSLQHYRDFFQSFGINPLIGCCLSYPQSSRQQIGFDFACEFEPRYFFNSRRISTLTRMAALMKTRFPGFFEYFGYLRDYLRKASKSHVFSYADYLREIKDGSLTRSLRSSIGDSLLMRSLFLSWDNTPRYGNRATKINYDGIKPDDLSALLQVESDDNLPVIINSWNEWSEGAALEPALVGNELRKAFLNILSGREVDSNHLAWPD